MALVTICTVAELPAPGEMRELSVEGKSLCVANEAGVYAAIDNVCPHRGGPLAEGILEDGKVLCPWHAWAFDLQTGVADHDSSARVGVYALRVEGERVLVELPV
jgi:nitrite reductase (NADH) small subunit